ncbi:MAG: hypothetical protein WCX71_01660 [Candidatus Buchananbacteria bacterium]
MSYLTYFFSLKHLFSLRPPAMSQRALIILAVIFSLFIILGVGAKIALPKIKDGLKIKAFRRLYHCGLTIGILGLIFWFFAWQGVALLSARFWLLILAIIAVVWLGLIGRYFYIEVPKLRKDIDNKRKFDKYIP